MAQAQKSSIIFDESKRAFSGRDLFGYFCGDFGCNMSIALITNYMFLYYTQYLGIKLTHFSMLILVAKIIDAINDPIVGAFIDRSDPRGVKREKFKPWIMWFAPILAITACIMFIDSSAWSYTSKLLMASFGYLAWDLMYTVVNVPYGALASAITPNSVQRSQLSTARSYGQYIAQIPIQVLIPLLIYTTVTQNNSEVSVFLGERMFPIAIGLGVLSLVAFFLLLRNTEERLVHVGQELDGESAKESYDLVATIKGFVTNRAMLGIALASLFQVLFIHTAPQLYQLNYQLYYNDGRMNSWTIISTLIPLFFGSSFGQILLKKYGTKGVSAKPALIAAIIFAVYAFLPMPTNMPWLFLAIQIIANTFGFGMTVYVWAMVGDAIDYQEWETGDRNEGSVYAMYSMIRKIGQGLGQAAVPLIIALAIPGLNLSESATWLPEYANGIKVLSGVFPAVGWLGIFIALNYIYNLSPDKLEKIQKDLNRQ